MATLPATLFFLGNRKYQVGTIQFDLILSEDHNFDNIITSHNVEDGSVITDHIKNELLNGTVTGMITNFSLKIDGITTNRAQDAFEAMERLWREKSLVSIITVMRRYDNVAITNVRIGRSENTGEAISMNVGFREIKIVKLKAVQVDATVRVRDTSTVQNKQASPPADISRTTPQAVTRTPTQRVNTRGVGGTW